jgi:(S)-citramalyl-CoA lyase
MVIRRTLLFTPADRPERIAKAAQMPADVIVLELEDGVAPAHKNDARANAGHCLASLDFGDRELGVRINRITTAPGLDDLRALASWPRKPDVLLLPKTESAAEVLIYEAYLSSVGVSCQLVPLIESARGLLVADEIAKSSQRVTALVFGGGDLAADLGCRFSWEALLPYRAGLVMAAAPAGIPVIDVPYISVRDEAGLRKEAKAARDIGMTGKVCIHPDQLPPVNEAFSPSFDEVERARRILAAAAIGPIPLVVDGQMIDGPLLRLSERVIAAHERSKATPASPKFKSS